MSTLKQLAEEMRNLTKVANRDLEGWDPMTLPGVKTAKVQAQQKIDKMMPSYRRAILASTQKVFVIGNAKRTAAFLEGLDGEFFVADGEYVYRKFAANITRTTNPNKPQFGRPQLSMLVEDLEDLALKLGYDAPYTVQFDPNYLNTDLASNEALVELIRATVRKSYGDDLNRLYIEHTIYNLVTSRLLDDAVIPAVITGLTEAEIKVLSGTLFAGRPSVFVNLDETKGVAKNAKAVVLKALGLKQTSSEPEPTPPTSNTEPDPQPKPSN